MYTYVVYTYCSVLQIASVKYLNIIIYYNNFFNNYMAGVHDFKTMHPMYIDINLD